jgi:hypothetical protein
MAAPGTSYLYTIKGEIRRPDHIVELGDGWLLLVKKICGDNFGYEYDCLCQVLNVATEEIREQRVDNCNLHRKWKETVLARRDRFAADDVTPQVLMPRAKEGR